MSSQRQDSAGQYSRRFFSDAGRARRLAIAVTVTLSVAGLAAYQCWPRIQLRAARTQLDASRFALAQAVAQAVLSRDPRCAEAHLLLARALRKQQQPGQSLPHVFQAARLGAAPDAFRPEYALCLAALGQRREAQPILQETFQAGTTDPDVPQALSEWAMENFYLDKAVAYLDAWVQLTPRDVRPLLLRAEACKRLFPYPEGAKRAIADYQGVLAIDPNHYEARLELGKELREKGKVEEAGAEFRICHARYPDDVEAAYQLASCYAETGEFDEAEQLLHWVLEKEPEHAGAVVALSKLELSLALDRPDDAIERLSDLVQRQPYHDKARYILSLALQRVGRSEEAAKHRDEWQRLKSAVDEMTRLIEQIRQSPEDAELRYKAGMLLTAQGLESEGARWLATVLQINPNHGPARRALARISHQPH